MFKGLCGLLANMWQEEQARVPEQSHIDLVLSDTHLLHTYLCLSQRPRSPREIAVHTMVPEYKVREYLHMLDERGAVCKQRCGSWYVLTAQGRADVDMVEDIFLYDVAKHLAPKLSNLQLRLVRLSKRYALKMIEKHQEDLPYP